MSGVFTEFMLEFDLGEDGDVCLFGHISIIFCCRDVQMVIVLLVLSEISCIQGFSLSVGDGSVGL